MLLYTLGVIDFKQDISGLHTATKPNLTLPTQHQMTIGKDLKTYVALLKHVRQVSASYMHDWVNKLDSFGINQY